MPPIVPRLLAVSAVTAATWMLAGVSGGPRLACGVITKQ